MHGRSITPKKLYRNDLANAEPIRKIKVKRFIESEKIDYQQLFSKLKGKDPEDIFESHFQEFRKDDIQE